MTKEVTREDISSDENAIIIDRKISIEKIKRDGAGDYYNQVKWKLKSKLNKLGSEGKKIFINLIPKSEIKDLWIVRVLLTLQREITSFIVFPKSRFSMEDVHEWIHFFEPNEIVEINQ